jgi:NAD-dependent SIR2 family protein deacetylase
MINAEFIRAAECIANADGLLITAGAGMGVDSGLPNFRGNEGFWRAYPALGQARIAFEEIANPQYFHTDPALAWGFYGHRLALYRRTEPHAGFALLRAISACLLHGAFVYTSNVDGQFQKAKFDDTRILECHGSIHWLQCLSPACNENIWSADGFRPQIDASVGRLRNSPPHCPMCGGIARPNILMFNDWHWIEGLAIIRQDRLRAWLSKVERLVTVELGVGCCNSDRSSLWRVNEWAAYPHQPDRRRDWCKSRRRCYSHGRSRWPKWHCRSLSWAGASESGNLSDLSAYGIVERWPRSVNWPFSSFQGTAAA